MTNRKHERSIVRRSFFTHQATLTRKPIMEVQVITETKISGSLKLKGDVRFDPSRLPVEQAEETKAGEGTGQSL